MFENYKDFSIQCKPNFDIGIATANLDSGIFRPANFGIVSIAAGDMSSPYNLNKWSKLKCKSYH
ncbi:MAG: hypothetical protein IPK10_17075 [Bacteroidetes bacterium]|nr:hypothetical protein [Bacteroidota bacterium]